MGKYGGGIAMTGKESISKAGYLTQNIEKGQRLFKILLTPLLISVIVLLNFWELASLKELRNEYEQDSFTELDLVGESTKKSLEELWANEWLLRTSKMAQNPILIEETEKLLALEQSPELLLQNKTHQKVRQLYRDEFGKDNTMGFFIISPENLSLSSNRNINLALTNPIAVHKPFILDKIKAGKAQMIPPIPSDIRLSQSKYQDLTMFFGAPIYNDKGEYIASFVIRLNTHEFFKKILQVNWFKQTGDIYAYDLKGYLLNKPRFFHQQEIYETITPGGPAPGEGLNYRLTPERMKKAIDRMENSPIPKGYLGLKNDTYLDYRNKEAHCAWYYLRDLNMVLAIKIDKDESMAGYKRIKRHSIIQLLIIDAIIVLIIILIGAVTRKFLLRSQKRENYFSTIINQAADGIIILNNKNRINQINISIEKMLGYSADEIINRPLLKLISSSQIKELKKKKEVEIYISGKYKADMPVRISTSTASIGNEEISILLVHDITEEVKQREAVKKLSTVVEQNPMSIVLANKNWEIEYINKQFEKEYGYNSEELISQSSDIFVPEDPKIEGHFPSITIEKKGIWQGEMLNKRKNGEEFWVSATITGIKNEVGEITHYVSIKENVTEKKKQQALYRAKSKQLHESNLKLKQSQKAALSIMQDANMQRERAEKATNAMTKLLEARKKAEIETRQTNYMLRMVLDNIPARVFWKDKNLNYLGCNNSFALDSGKLLPEEVVGKNDFEIFPEEIAELYRTSDKEILTTGTPMVNFDSPVIDEKGNKTEVRTSKVPLTNFENEYIGILGIYEDVTELKETKSQLIKAKEKAEESDRLKSEFIANMSHEIRTPMNAVLGFAEILEKKNKEAIHDQYINGIRTSGKALLKIINDILDLSKIEAGKLDVQLNPVSIDNILHEIETMFKHKALEKGIDFSILIPANLPKYLLLDELRIRQILLNLSSNAIKFTSEGSVSIDLSLDRISKRHVDITFSVIDTGIGIPVKSQQKVFEAFEQQENQDAKKYGGTGLGLAISNKLAQMMDSNIELISTKGEGSTFKFSLKQVEIYSEEINENREIKINPEDIIFNRAKVLVADDVKNNREIIKGFLAESALELYEAENGLEAISTAKEITPDLIFMDIRMPGMDGFNATTNIRKIKHLKNTAIIALTASAFANVENEAKELGFDDYLRKPVEMENVVSVLSKHLKHRIIKTDAKANKQSQKAFNFNLIPEKNLSQLSQILCKLENRKSNKLLKDLGMLLQEIGNKEKLVNVKQYGEELLESVNSFNIENTQKLLSSLLKEYKQTVTN